MKSLGTLTNTELFVLEAQKSHINIGMFLILPSAQHFVEIQNLFTNKRVCRDQHRQNEDTITVNLSPW